MKIGEVARRVGIPIDTVRYYERNGLLPPPARRASGYRDYHDSDIARLNFVLRAKALGFTLIEIRELLDLSDAAEGDMGNIRELAASKLQDIEQRIGQLARVRDALKGLVEACPGRGHVSGCPIRSALFDLQEPIR
ncbi:heavy metal-responsive transcriptional regulator [Lysobacter humi (ex Lee et al. 2017)]